MNRTLLATLVAAALAAPAAAAADDPVVVLHQQLAAAGESAGAQADVWKRWADDFSQEMRTSMNAMFSGRVVAFKPVKGAPYGAEVITESNQALADGNVISRRTSGAIYRDGEGRTRQETGEGKARSIFISDPVEGKQVVLTPGTKQAIEIAVHADGLHDTRQRIKEKRVVRVGATEIRIEDGKVFVGGKEVPNGTIKLNSGGKEIRVDDGKVTIDGQEVASGRGTAHVIVKTIDGKETDDGLAREEVRVQVLRAGDALAGHPPMPPMPPMPPLAGAPLPPMPPMPPMPGVQTMRFESVGRLGKGVTTSLGTKEFDGVKAEGKSTAWTIAAGEIGNRNPISVTSESWYSPELQATVYSRYNDPRTGESIYRLASIKRGEPAPDLFKVPEDYKVRSRGAAK